MATKNYTLSELKTLVLDQMNQIKGLEAPFGNTNADADNSYDEAVMQCGFEIPATTDADKDKKYFWLIQRIRRWYMGRLLEQYSLRFKAGDMEAQQIYLNIRSLCKDLDDAFQKARESETESYLFINADTSIDSAIIVSPGFIEDRIGQSIEERTS